MQLFERAGDDDEVVGAASATPNDKVFRFFARASRGRHRGIALLRVHARSMPMCEDGRQTSVLLLRDNDGGIAEMPQKPAEMQGVGGDAAELGLTPSVGYNRSHRN